VWDGGTCSPNTMTCPKKNAARGKELELGSATPSPNNIIIFTKHLYSGPDLCMCRRCTTTGPPNLKGPFGGGGHYHDHYLA